MTNSKKLHRSYNKVWQYSEIKKSIEKPTEFGVKKLYLGK